MSGERKPRWKLQIFWGGDWRTIMENENRVELAQYASSCPDDLQLRIIDTEEEVKARGRRH